MASAKWLRMQAARCASLTKQTDDEDSRKRYQQLEQTYLQLAEFFVSFVYVESQSRLGFCQREICQLGSNLIPTLGCCR